VSALTMIYLTLLDEEEIRCGYPVSHPHLSTTQRALSGELHLKSNRHTLYLDAQTELVVTVATARRLAQVATAIADRLDGSMGKP